jgi:hypothetical protein
MRGEGKKKNFQIKNKKKKIKTFPGTWVRYVKGSNRVFSSAGRRGFFATESDCSIGDLPFSANRIEISKWKRKYGSFFLTLPCWILKKKKKN